MSRNSSLGAADTRIIVSPLDKNPAILSEETEDDSYLFRKASSTSNPHSANYENMMRRTSDESVKSYSSTGGGTNYQNVSIGGGGVGLKSVSLPRRHDVIMEDPNSTPQPMESKIEDFHSTFPRRIPSRTQSMHVHANNATTPPKVPPHRTGTSDQMRAREKGLCLRRGASLHGAADLPSSANKTSSSSIGPIYPPMARRGSSSEREDTAGIGGEFSSMAVKQHRRTQSLEGRERGGGGGMMMGEVADSAVQRRVVSEYYPRTEEEEEREEEEEGREEGEDSAGSDGGKLDELPNISVSSLGATALDSSEQVSHPPSTHAIAN